MHLLRLTDIFKRRNVNHASRGEVLRPTITFDEPPHHFFINERSPEVAYWPNDSLNFRHEGRVYDHSSSVLHLGIYSNFHTSPKLWTIFLWTTFLSSIFLCTIFETFKICALLGVAGLSPIFFFGVLNMEDEQVIFCVRSLNTEMAGNRSDFSLNLNTNFG